MVLHFPFPVRVDICSSSLENWQMRRELSLPQSGDWHLRSHTVVYTGAPVVVTPTKQLIYK